MMGLNLLGLNSRLPDRGQLMFESVVGSHARGVASVDSDLDLVGIFVPYYEELYSYKVPGFGTHPKRFKTLQVPDVSVHLEGYGNATVDVLALDLVHFFNMLIKPSPNHVEYLFFGEKVNGYSSAGKYLLAHRDVFLTNDVVHKCVALGCSVIYSHGEKTNKDYAFATRFFAYANQLVENGTIDPEALRSLNLRILEETPEKAKEWAMLFMDVGKEAEQKVTTLPEHAYEEEVNDLLLAVLKLHWAERSVLDYAEEMHANG